MNYTIELSENRKFFRIRPKVPITTKIVRQWAVELTEMSHAHGILHFLFDVRDVKNVSTILENYMFSYNEAEELKLQKNVRSAILVNQEDESHDFVETTMKNVGYNVRLFTDEASALKWMEQEIEKEIEGSDLHI